MGLQEQMPAAFAKVHDRYRTPHVAIILMTLFSILLAVSGTFTTLALLSAMARLMTYIAAAVAVLVLRKKKPSPESFRIPAGILVPVLTVLLSLFLLSAATVMHWITGTSALMVGVILYLSRRQTQSA
jgi:amino acid transporter